MLPTIICPICGTATFGAVDVIEAFERWNRWESGFDPSLSQKYMPRPSYIPKNVKVVASKEGDLALAVPLSEIEKMMNSDFYFKDGSGEEHLMKKQIDSSSPSLEVAYTSDGRWSPVRFEDPAKAKKEEAGR